MVWVKTGRGGLGLRSIAAPKTQFPVPWDEAHLGLGLPLSTRRLGELSVNESETNGLSFSAHMRA